MPNDTRFYVLVSSAFVAGFMKGMYEMRPKEDIYQPSSEIMKMEKLPSYDSQGLKKPFITLGEMYGGWAGFVGLDSLVQKLLPHTGDAEFMQFVGEGAFALAPYVIGKIFGKTAGLVFYQKKE